MQGATGSKEILNSFIPVSIHAPYAGSDIICLNAGLPHYQFQSTPPMQGATET